MWCRSIGLTGRFTASISDPWTLAAIPQGGIVAAIAARAMASDARRAGPVVAISVGGVRRKGRGRPGRDRCRRAAARPLHVPATATVRNPGATSGLTAVAVFGSKRRGFEFTDLVFPDVPGPDGLRSFRDPVPDGVDFEFPRPPLPFWEEIIETRPAVGRPPWEPFEDGPAEVVYWYRVDDPPVDDDGMLDPLAAIVLCDTMPDAVGPEDRPRPRLVRSERRPHHPPARPRPSGLAARPQPRGRTPATATRRSRWRCGIPSARRWSPTPPR